MLCVAYENILPQFKHLNLGQYLRIYSSNDSKILKEGLLNFFNTLSDLKIPYDKKSLTCGSISLNYYIKKYNKINLNLERGIKNVIRSAFYGGRCEVFGNQLYSEKVLHFDFSGMYQQCMEESLPFGNYIYESANFNINVPGFYYIHIIYTDYLPILPLRLSKLFFKEGEISG